MNYYADVNSDNVCVSVQETTGNLGTHAAHLIPVSGYEVLGKKLVNGVWEDYTPPTVRKAILTKLEYMDRFTDAELAGIYTAAKSSVQVEVWLEKFKLATDINIDDPRTIDGLQALEAAGLLAAGRAAEILA